MAAAVKSRAPSKTRSVTTAKSKKTQERKPLPRFLVAIIAGLAVIALFQAPAIIKRSSYHVSQVFLLNKSEPAAAQLFPMGANEVYVPRFNINASLVFIQAKSEVAFQRALQDGVVHYPDTANIGELGNAYFFGHSSDLIWARGNYKTVFALLPDIQTGDVIIATDKNGHPYRYIAYETLIVNPDDTSVLDQFENKEAILSLQTSYPVGTALQRFIVRARLVEGPSAITPKK